MKVILSVLLCLVIVSNNLTAQSVYMATEEGGAGGIAILLQIPLPPLQYFL
jgi:hypothetical protein